MHTPKLTLSLVAALLALPVARAAEPPAPPAPPAAAPAPNDAGRADLEKRLEAARTRLDAAANEVADLSTQLGGRYVNVMRTRIIAPPGVMLGVQIEARRGEPGVKVAAVSPGGAAEAAGVTAGDVIVAIDGVDLLKAGEPPRALMDHLRGVEPGTKVRLKVDRGGKPQEFTVTPQMPPPGMMAGMPGRPGMRGAPPRPGEPPRPFGPRGPGGDGRGPDGPHGAMDHGRGHGPGMGGPGMGGPGMMGPGGGRGGLARLLGADLELADVSPKLGSYFGTKGGVLVVRAGTDGALKLQDGDVITAIDGRAPTSASHATRILRSYQPGEKLQVQVLRDRKSLTLAATLAR